MNKLEQYEQAKKQIVAKDWAEYELAIKKIVKDLRL
jgi:hypothetical protein